MGNLSKVVLGGVEYNIKDKQARTDLEQLCSDQRCLPADQATIEPLPSELDKVVTTDTTFAKNKEYYKKSGDSFVQLVVGVDYNYNDTIADFGETVYDTSGWSIQDLCKRVNDCIAVFNKLIAAHAQSVSGGTQP